MGNNILFIGGGNMATSLIGGLIANGYDNKSIAVVDIDKAQLESLATQFSIATYSDVIKMDDKPDVIVLAVKPQVLKSTCQSLSNLVQTGKPLVVSIAAGVRSDDIQHWLGGGAIAITRAMPNTPALVQCGASGLFANPSVDESQRRQAESILAATGVTLWVDDEDKLDTVTALSGSGPAYFFRIMESMIKAGIELGLTPDAARLLTLQTASGAAKMALQSSDDVANLRAKVTSPGGTTEQGLRILDEHNIDHIIKQVLAAARKRSIELADQLGEK